MRAKLVAFRLLKSSSQTCRRSPHQFSHTTYLSVSPLRAAKNQHAVGSKHAEERMSSDMCGLPFQLSFTLRELTKEPAVKLTEHNARCKVVSEIENISASHICCCSELTTRAHSWCHIKIYRTWMGFRQDPFNVAHVVLSWRAPTRLSTLIYFIMRQWSKSAHRTLGGWVRFGSHCGVANIDIGTIWLDLPKGLKELGSYSSMHPLHVAKNRPCIC